MTTLKQALKMSGFIIGILNLSVASANMGEGVQVELPVDLIKVQAVLDEGTQVELSEAQVEEMLPWAQNSKVFLEDLLERVRTLPLSDKFDQTVSGIKNTVLSSAPKNTELLMRYVLNRSLKVVEVIDEQIGSEKNTSTLNVQFNILKDSIELAIKYYKNDLSFLTNQIKSDSLVSFSAFGINYSQFLYQYTKLVFDASAQYQLMRMTLGFLQWDLYRDQNNNLYAPVIMTINHELSNNPKDLDVSDQEYLKRVRNMKRTYEQQKDKLPDIAKQSHLYNSFANLSPMAIDTLPKPPLIRVSDYDHITESKTPPDLEIIDLICPNGSYILDLKGVGGLILDYFTILCSDGSQYTTRENTTSTFSDPTTYNGGFDFLTFKRARWDEKGMFLWYLELLPIKSNSTNPVIIQEGSEEDITHGVNIKCPRGTVIRGLRVVTRHYDDVGNGFRPYVYSFEGIYCY